MHRSSRQGFRDRAQGPQFGKAHPILTEQMLPMIAEIDEAAEVLATSDETQTVATNRIGQNVENAAKSTSQITQNIGGVAEAARDTSRGSAQSQSAAQALTRMAVELQDLVGTFQV